MFSRKICRIMVMSGMAMMLSSIPLGIMTQNVYALDSKQALDKTQTAMDEMITSYETMLKENTEMRTLSDNTHETASDAATLGSIHIEQATLPTEPGMADTSENENESKNTDISEPETSKGETSSSTETSEGQDEETSGADIEETSETTTESAPEETPAVTEPAVRHDAGGRITPVGGVHMGPSGKETYYNLSMNGVIFLMRELGYSEEEYPYWVRDDGVKMFGDYVMVAADLSIRPKGTILECSMGTAMVVDTGDLETYQLDIAVNW